MTTDSIRILEDYLAPGASVSDDDGIAAAPINHMTPGLEANRYYFNHPAWLKNWFNACHRYPELRQRWLAATGLWDGKIVVDIGCGPGNLLATLGAAPALIIGVDIARGSLEAARQLGYEPLLADVQDLPLRDGFADIVAINSTLHHCDDMAQVLREAARLVKPGGLLVTDHDPQKSAFALRGFGKLLWNARVPIYRLLKRGGHSPQDDEQKWALATEIHHRPGDGVSPGLFNGVLQPLGFHVELFAHNNRVGASTLQGEMGIAPFAMRLSERLSGINPDSREGAITMMCVARRRED